MLHKEANFKMIPKTTATFIGHSECYGITKEQIKQSVLTLIDNGVTDFLCGGQGKFDNMCARCVYELKKRFSEYKKSSYHTVSVIQNKRQRNLRRHTVSRRF